MLADPPPPATPSIPTPSNATPATAMPAAAAAGPAPPVLLADPWLLAVHKPAGLLSQPGLGPQLRDAVTTRLEPHWGPVQLVHRLDRDTSGLLLLAREPEAHRRLSRAFAERLVAKTYRAAVLGVPAAAGEIDQPIARASTRPPRYAVHPAGRPSRTHWRLLEDHGAWSLLELVPHTGRSHQLRVHLALLGHPILGDPLYGCPRALALAPALRLHALRLGFPHPQHGRWLELAVAPPWGEAPVP